MLTIRKGQSVDLSVGRGVVPCKFTGIVYASGSIEFQTPSGKVIGRTAKYLADRGYRVAAPKPAKADESE